MLIHENTFYDNLQVYFGLKSGYCDEPCLQFARVDITGQTHSVLVPVEDIQTIIGSLLQELTRRANQNVKI